MLASTILTAPGAVRTKLLDQAAVTWSDAALLRCLTAAQREVAVLRPESYTVSNFIPLVAGIAQQLPADGTGFISADLNAVSKRRATMVDRELLDEVSRFWAAATPERDVRHWTADPRDPRRFDVYPPNDGTGSLSTLYHAAPPELASMASSIALPDSFEPALTLLTMAACYEATTRRQDVAKAAQLRAEARNLLGVSAQTQAAIAPRDTSKG